MTRPEPRSDDADAPDAGTEGSRALGKGRPTPKRSASQRRRAGPVPPPPQTRREAVKRMREQRAQDRSSRRSGYVAGDERAMLRRDAGPVRRLVRDVVDARRNVGVILLPLAVLLVVAQVVGNADFLRIATNVWVAGILAMLIDAVLLGVRVRSRVRVRFPDERRTGRHIGYALLRSTTFRRLRMPPAQVDVGDQV
ncbi:MAG: DUF3043 domain-containing protein [Actinomycetota bacterium]|nr:DUF3043 domain-containing protein [Actinomycetota bacterium]